MSIPLDRLYNFVDSLCGGDIVIYRFFPYGSKKITDLSPVKNADPVCFNFMVCNDHEPLDYHAYSDPSVLDELSANMPNFIANQFDQKFMTELKPMLLRKNLKLGMSDRGFSLNDILILHSEQKSSNLIAYENSGFIGVYWWSHAMIARDWFRYAQHDPELLEPSNITHDFLIYNRAWSGSREYRLKFAELIVQNDLQTHCRMKFNPLDNGQHHSDHVYHNPGFLVTIALENYFDLNTFDAAASADYTNTDYKSTNIEVVLETLFDDQRWHLTEKILRPIACGQPFIIAATPGSLEYLRSYGFHTFSPLIDETYDTIQDPVARLKAITAEMRRITDLAVSQKQSLFAQLRTIAQHNRQWFFSSEFHHSIIRELQYNLKQGRDHLASS
jgi:hypothetical protein